jgi:superfamily II DNA or RNA helicase
MYNLRDYQIESVEAMNNIPIGERGLIVLPTGSGKTICMAELCRQSTGRILIVVISKELREQTVDKIKLMCGNDISIGSVQANLNEISTNIVVSTRQSLSHKKSTRIEDMLEYGEFTTIIFDEIHVAIEQCMKIIQKLDTSKCKLLGFTATPFNKSMTKIFNEITYSKDILWMIENKYLIEPKAYQIQTTTDISKVKSVGGEFIQSELELAVNTDERNDLIVRAYREHAMNRKHTIAFASGIEHSRDLCAEFIRQGITCAYVDSTLTKEERENILEGFRNNLYKVVCNVGVLSTGYDFPEVDNIMFCRPTKSKILYIQQLGRGLRIADDKENCLVLDFRDVISKHNLMDISSVFDVDMLDGETPTEAIEREKKADEQEKEEREKEKIRKEEEKRRVEEIIAREMELFNTNLDSTFRENSYYDWYKINYKMYALSESSDTHYVILKDGNDFNTYKVCTKKNENYCEELDIFGNVTEAIKYIENEKLTDARSFADKYAKWKNDLPTPKQLQYIKFKTVHNKWEAHLYFTVWQLKKIIESI